MNADEYDIFKPEWILNSVKEGQLVHPTEKYYFHATTTSKARGDFADDSIPEDEEMKTEDEEEASLLKDSEFDCLRAVLDNSDVILHVLDARDPLAYQSTQLFNQFKQNKQRKLIHLLNKIGMELFRVCLAKAYSVSL